MIILSNFLITSRLLIKLNNEKNSLKYHQKINDNHNFLYFIARNPLELDPSVATRQVLGPVKLNDEVLARFKDDGWYYRGKTK